MPNLTEMKEEFKRRKVRQNSHFQSARKEPLARIGRRIKGGFLPFALDGIAAASPTRSPRVGRLGASASARCLSLSHFVRGRPSRVTAADIPHPGRPSQLQKSRCAFGRCIGHGVDRAVGVAGPAVGSRDSRSEEPGRCPRKSRITELASSAVRVHRSARRISVASSAASLCRVLPFNALSRGTATAPTGINSNGQSR